MSAADDTSLLAHLAYKLADGRTETTATEALGYILNRSSATREALRDMLKVDGADVGPLARVETEIVGEKRDCIDLAAYDEAGKERLLIEVKFWAGLADNQPAEYLGRLPDDDNVSVLLFVAPESRLETLWPRILEMAKRGDFTLDGISETGRLRVAAVAEGNRRLMLTSWRSLLEKIRSRAGVDSSTEEDIRQLNGLCEREDSAAFLPLRAPEFGPEFPRRMLNFRRLVDDAVERLVEKEKRAKGLQGGRWTTGYGRAVHIGRSSTWAYARLGVDYERWAKKGEGPIWIQFGNDDTNTMPLNEILKRLGQSDGALPLDLRTGVEYEEVIEGLVNQLRDLADRIAEAS